MFNDRIRIKEVLNSDPDNRTISVMGWVRTFRNNQFIALNDGSTNNNLQVVAELGRFDEPLLKRITTENEIKITQICWLRHNLSVRPYKTAQFNGGF